MTASDAAIEHRMTGLIFDHVKFAGIQRKLDGKVASLDPPAFDLHSNNLLRPMSD